MANTILTEIFSGIADAIRAKGVTGTMTPLEMAAKISSIVTDGGGEGGGDEGGLYYVASAEQSMTGKRYVDWPQLQLQDLSASDGSELPETLTLDAQNVSGHYEITASESGNLSGDLPQFSDIPSDAGVPYTKVAEFSVFDGTNPVPYTIAVDTNGDNVWIQPGTEEGTFTAIGRTITVSKTGYIENLLHLDLGSIQNWQATTSISFGAGEASSSEGGVQ